jgi:hypothetical protein
LIILCIQPFKVFLLLQLPSLLPGGLMPVLVCFLQDTLLYGRSKAD